MLTCINTNIDTNTDTNTDSDNSTDLEQSLEFVPSVPESSHSIHVEGVLSLAHCSGPLLLSGDTDALVCLAAVVYEYVGGR